MALVLFESRVNMITAATPSIGGFLVAYDTLDGVLKQKDHLGVITPIGSGGGIGSLAQTLSIGSTTGTNSIYLDINTQVRSNGGSASLRLDNGSSGNYVELSSSNSITGSTLAMTDNNILLKGLSSSIQMSTTDIRLNFATNQFLLQNNNSYLKLGTTNVLEFTTATSSRASGNRVPAFISSNGSRFSNTVTNSVIIGGSGITGTQSNSVYTPNLIIKDGGYVKGISGDGQLRFNIDNETYLTSGTNIIGILGANSAVMAAYNGIFITDNIDTITTTSTSENAIILSSNTTINDGLTNTVVIGGQYLLVNNSDTVYLGGTVDINNQYKLPISDGTSGQVIKTDGAGNLSWSSGVGTPVITVTAVAFAGLSTLSSSSTYRITDADVDLYGGTEIYLTTNSQGVLNDVGEGKFYNPRYDQTVEGYKIWSGTSSSYATGSVVYWGGRAWSNNSGTNTSSPLTIFFLNPTEWTVVPYTNGIHYNISYDKIKYDRVTDKIIYRDEKGTNIVSTNSENIRYWIYDMGLYDPIKVFQWGNLYNPLTTKGIASQNIVNSYNENINFIGILQTNITMNNLSSQFNMNTGTSSVQDNLILNNYSYDRQSTLLGSEYNMSFQSGDTITIDGNLMVQGTTTTINSENLIVKDPIIVLAASQSGTPILDSGLFVDRGIGATQAFIWDESMDEFKFISTLDGADVSGDISIANYSNVRTGVLKVGTGDFDSNDRFLVSSSGGTVSLIVDQSGYVYNRGGGGITTNTAFGFMTLGLNTTGSRNTAVGASALSVNTTGSYNTALGHQSLMFNLGGSYNTSLGHQSLNQNTSGQYNSVIGVNSMRSNKTGSYNTVLGANSLYNNTSGTLNISLGYNSLYKNTVGSSNIAIGYYSLYNNTTTVSLLGSITPGSGYVTGTYSNVPLIYATGSTALSYPTVNIIVDGSGLVSSVTLVTYGSCFQDSSTVMTVNNFYLGSTGSGFQIGISSLSTGSNNMAIGYNSMYNNTTGYNNMAVGYNSMLANSTGYNNIALGFNSLYSNTTGYYNTALGYQSLLSNTTGSDNTALGYQSLYNNTIGYQNTAIGEKSLYSNTTATNSVAIGHSSLYKNNTGNWNTALGVDSLRSNTTIVNTLAGTFSAGTGYTPGTYTNIVLFGVGGTYYYPGNNVSDYPQVTIVVGSGGTVSSATLTWKGTVVPDETVVFGIQTGSQPYQIPGGGSGFRINILSIGRAGEYNVSLGYRSLYELRTGSRNVALGSYAGSIYGYIDDTNDSIYIGHSANSVNFNVSNEIVIGATALGNGSNTVTLGNDNIQKTILKGNVAVGFTGTSVSPNCDLEVKGHQTFTLPDNNMTSGDVVYFGNVTTGLTPGSIYYYDAGDWTLASASVEASSSGLLAIALGTSSSDGMLLRGFSRFDLSVVYSAMTTLGTVQFLSVTDGEFEEAQPTLSGEVVRVIGYCVDTSLLYFCPDTTWIELL